MTAGQGQDGQWENEGGRWHWRGPAPPRMEERPWRQQFAMLAVAMSTILVIPLGVAGLAYRNYANNRVNDNRAAIKREAADASEALARERKLRIQVTNRLKAADARNCRADEKQDAVIVSLLLSVPRTELIQDAIDALEPPNEPDCPPFPAGFGP